MKTSTRSILVIGYGNTLRGDDGVGPVLAQRIAQWGMPFVETKSLQQLGPELAGDLARADAALFLDACLNGAKPPCWRSLRTEREAFGWTDSHAGGPRDLLELTKRVYGRASRAWSVALPALSFDIGRPLSVVASRGLEQAAIQIRAFLEHRKSMLCSKGDAS